MKLAAPSSKNSASKPKPSATKTNASEKNLNAPKQNPNRLKLVKAVYAGHVRGGHAFH